MGDILWTDDALRDLDDLAAFIAQDNPRAAEKLARRIVEAVAGLSVFPRIGCSGRIAGTRELVISGTS